MDDIERFKQKLIESQRDLAGMDGYTDDIIAGLEEIKRANDDLIDKLNNVVGRKEKDYLMDTLGLGFKHLMNVVFTCLTNGKISVI